jgi:hypothetical protein
MTYRYFDNIDITPSIQSEIAALEKAGAFYQVNEHSENEWDVFVPMIWNDVIRFLNVGWSIPNNFGGRFVLGNTFAHPFITAIGIADELRKFYANLEVRVHFGGKAAYCILPTSDAELVQFILSRQ